MCRWNLFGMVQHPRIRDLQYYARLDTDSRFKEPVREARTPPPKIPRARDWTRHQSRQWTQMPLQTVYP